MKIRSDQVLRVYESIFQKVSILSLDPVIAYLGVLWYQDVIFDHENLSRFTIQGLHVDYVKTSP